MFLFKKITLSLILIGVLLLLPQPTAKKTIPNNNQNTSLNILAPAQTPETPITTAYEMATNTIKEKTTILQEKIDKENISNETIKQLEETYKKEALHATNYSFKEEMQFFPGLKETQMLFLSPEDKERRIKKIQEKEQTLINNLNLIIEQWEQAVKEEKEKREKEKREKEKREKQAKRTQSNSSCPTNPVSARIDCIMRQLPFKINYIIDSAPCTSSQALGCYPFGNYIVITPLGLTKANCDVRNTIAHEYRHWWQYQQGIMGPPWTDERYAEWERDAYAFGDSYGC